MAENRCDVVGCPKAEAYVVRVEALADLLAGRVGPTQVGRAT